MSEADARAQLIEAASGPFRRAGRFAHGFARGKLKADPAFAQIMMQGVLAKSTDILDLGCGQGLLAAWLLACRDSWSAGRWPDWPDPPQPRRLRGIERNPRALRCARLALGEHFSVIGGDVRNAPFGSGDCIVILDVLHYIDYAAQEQVLRRAHSALSADGVLLLRVGDAGGGWRFYWSKCVDRSVLLLRFSSLGRLYCRSLQAWTRLLDDTGFHWRILPGRFGFANVMLIAQPK